MEKAGTLRKIAPRIYTPNFSESAETIVKRNLFHILSHLYPGAMLSHRTALEFKPTAAGHVFLTYTYTKRIHLPGITLRFIEGQGPLQGDNRFYGELYAAQTERAMLENLQVSRQPGAESKTLTLPQIEEKLEGIIRVKGEEGLNELRDRARDISVALNMQTEFEKLNRLIGALLSTQPSKLLSSPLAIARAFGHPYDPQRLSLFETLFVALKTNEFEAYLEKNNNVKGFKNFAFFEAYFSNYIEGTEFELSDAKQIIESNTPMSTRNEDSHDILGTYKLVSNKAEMEITPANAAHLIELLLNRHRLLMSARKNLNPGQFKEQNNRAGDTLFVDYTLVKGTLIKGFEFQQALQHPFAKAVFMMFMVSEIHPFADGNGRVARVMMNAELVNGGMSKIIIPTVYRDDYLLALRQLSRQHQPSAFIRMMHRAWKFSANIFGENMDAMESLLVACNAFKEHHEAKLKIIAQ